MSTCAVTLDIVVQAPMVLDIQAPAPVVLDVALVGIQGPPGPSDLTGSDGIAVVGSDIRINIEELPLAPGV